MATHAAEQVHNWESAAFTVVVIMALVPQLLFSALYWKWIPLWIRNPYGRLAQLGSWCHIILLSLYLFLVLFGKYLTPFATQTMLILAFVPLVIYGFLQLILLRRAVVSSLEKNKEAVASDS